MGENIAIAAFPARKCAPELKDSSQVEQEERQDSARLDDDRVHLPIRIVEIDFHQGFGNSQMGRGTDRQEFSQPLNDTQNDGKKIYVQKASGVRVPRIAVRSQRNRLRAGRSPLSVLALEYVASLTSMIKP